MATNQNHGKKFELLIQNQLSTNINVSYNSIFDIPKEHPKQGEMVGRYKISGFVDKTENFGSTIYTADFIPKNEFICLYNGYDNAFFDQGECMVLDASVMIYKDDDKFRVFHKST